MRAENSSGKLFFEALEPRIMLSAASPTLWGGEDLTWIPEDERLTHDKLDAPAVLPGSVVIFEEDFADGTMDRWNVGDSNPASGYDYWDTVNDGNHPPSAWCAGDSDGGAELWVKYDNNMDAYMDRPFSLAGYSNASLQFDYNLHTEQPYDYLAVLINGEEEWRESGGPINWEPGDPGWHETIDLSAYDGQLISLRFLFHSDGLFSSYDGAFADNIIVSADPGEPDLQVFGGLNADPMNVNAGDDTALEFFIKNAGQGPITDTIYVKAYLSTDEVIETSDTWLDTLLLSNDLAPGDMLHVSNWHVDIPQDTFETRNYYIGIILDPSDYIHESDEGNNTQSAYPFHVEARPDLTVTSVSASPSQLAPGEFLDITYRISNEGYGRAGTFDNAFVLSPNTTIGDQDDIALPPAFSVSSLLADSYTQMTRSREIPTGTPEGFYYVGLVADSDGSVWETSEGNNTGRTSSQIYVESESDPVQITDVTAELGNGRFVSGTDLPEVANWFSADVTGDVVSVLFELDGGQSWLDDDPAGGWTTPASGDDAFNMSIVPEGALLTVTAYGMGDDRDEYTYADLDVLDLPGWMTQENVSYHDPDVGREVVFDGDQYIFDIFISDFDQWYATPADWLLIGGRETGLRIGSEFNLYSDLDGDVSSNSLSYGIEAKLLGYEILDYEWGADASGTETISFGKFEFAATFDISLGYSFTDDLEWQGLAGTAVLDLDLMEVSVPLGRYPVAGIPYIADIAVGGSASFGLGVHADATLALDGENYGWQEASVGFDAIIGLTGYAEARVLFVNGGVSLTGTIQQGLERTYVDGVGWGAWTAPGSGFLDFDVYVNANLLLWEAGATVYHKSWTLATWDFITGGDDPAETEYDEGDYEGSPVRQTASATNGAEATFVHAGDQEIYVHQRDAGGAWGPMEALTDNDFLEQNPTVAYDSTGAVFVAWEQSGIPIADQDGYSLQQRAEAMNIYWSRKTGDTWTSPQPVVSDSYVHAAPEIAFSPTGAQGILVWERLASDADDGVDRSAAEIMYALWNGSFWGPVQRLTNNAFADWTADVAFTGDGQIIVTWLSDDDGDYVGTEQLGTAQVNCAVGDGESWAYGALRSDGSTLAQWPQVVRIPNGDVQAVWLQLDAAGYGLYAATYGDGTNSWGPPAAVLTEEPLISAPSLSVNDDGRVFVVYMGSNGRENDLYTVTHASPWTPPNRITNDGLVYRQPTAQLLDSGSVVLRSAFEDYADTGDSPVSGYDTDVPDEGLFEASTNMAPVINLIHLDGSGEPGTDLVITWADGDIDDDALIALNWDVDTDPGNNLPEDEGVTWGVIATDISEDDAADRYSWTVDAPAGGDYYVWALIDDGAATSEDRLYVNAGQAFLEVDLQAESDTGRSNADNITNDNTPTYDVTVNRAGTIEIDWEDDDTVDLTAVVATAGVYEVTPASPLSDGVYPVSVMFTDRASNAAAAGAPTIVDSTAPIVFSVTPSGVVASEVTEIEIVFEEEHGLWEETVTDLTAYTLTASGGDGTFADGNEVDLSESLIHVEYDAVSTTAVISLTAPLTDERYQLTVRSGFAGEAIERVSIAWDGSQGNDHSLWCSVSGDGRYVAFESDASNLIGNDTNGKTDIFVYDRQMRTVERISVASDGAEGNGHSFRPAISNDGRYVAFGSDASNLVDGDTNSESDVFVRDRHSGVTERVSVASDGTQGNGWSGFPDQLCISADGRFVAFGSYASNLVSEDTNETYDVFVHDREHHETVRVSVASDGSEGDNSSDSPSMSADGRYVAFESRATNLVPADTNGSGDVFIHDRESGLTERVSVASDGSQADDWSHYASVSADGRYVAFRSSATNLVPADTNGTDDVFIHDREAGLTERVSVASDRTQGDGISFRPSLSADGRYVAFVSDATNFAASDTNGAIDVFLHDRESGITQRISVASDGTEANSWSDAPSISATGRYAAFASIAANLVDGDTNGAIDTFVYDRLGGACISDMAGNPLNDGLDEIACFTVDAQIPTVTADLQPGSDTGGSDSDNITSDTTPMYDVTVNEPGTIEIDWEDDDTVDLTAVAAAAGVYHYTPALPLADGIYPVSVAFTDRGSNVATDSALTTIDATAPAVSSVTPSGVVGSEVTEIEIVFEDEYGLWEETVVDRNHYKLVSSGGDGTFGDGNEVDLRGRITGVSYDPVTMTATLSLSPALSDEAYQLTVIGSVIPAGFVERVSVASDGTEGDEGGGAAAVSADGRYVAFLSNSTNLVAGDTNGTDDVFVHDRQTGVTERVSVASDGTQGNQGSFWPSISADGRYVAFASYATNLVAGDTNNAEDFFVHDCLTGITERVSVGSGGTQGDRRSGNFSSTSVSADGRYVAFWSESTNLVPGDTNERPDVFVRDRVTGVTERVSVASDATQGDGYGGDAAISEDGRYVTFQSDSTNLVAEDTNGNPDIFLHDRQTGHTRRVSVASDGTQAAGCSFWPSLSADGRYVAFSSWADNLVPGDTSGITDVFVHDRVTGDTEHVSVASDGTQGDDDSYSYYMLSISADGRYVMFTSHDTNLVAGDTNETDDVFVHDRQTGVTERVSIASDGTQSNNRSIGCWISADGQYVAFGSSATNLVAGDTNDSGDAFLHDRFGDEPVMDAAGNLLNDGSDERSLFTVDQQGIDIPDAGLQAAIREVIDKPSGPISPVDMESLTWLDFGGRGVVDLTGLEYAVNLQRLFGWNNQVTDITPLSGLTNLTELRLSTNQISDIAPLSCLTNLTDLELGANEIGDLTPLSGLTNLTNLKLGANQIGDLTPLSGLTNLSVLRLARNQINDIGPLSGLESLQELYLFENQIGNLGPLSELTNLTSLSLSDNDISDIGPLSGLTNLSVLYLEDNQIIDISALSGLTDLQMLRLSFNQIVDVSALSGLTNLEGLHLHDNQIIDINALSGLTSLDLLDLSRNQIVDISPLSTLTNLAEGLYLGENQIADIEALSGLTRLEDLWLKNNHVSDIGPLSGLTALQRLWLENNYLDLTPGSAAMTVIEALQDRGTTVYYEPQRVRPVVTSLVSDPEGVVVKPGPLTLTALVDSPDESGIVLVTFYVETNGTPGLQTGADGDMQVGEADTGGGDGWTVTLSTGEPDPGTYALYAQATDNDGDRSAEGEGAEFTVVVTVRDNEAPVAADDSYEVDQGGALLVPAAGVLANDEDADGDPMTAALVTGPANGSLALNADGSFDYTPSDGFTGTDTFTYIANDGFEDSNEALVTITVVNTSGNAFGDREDVDAGNGPRSVVSGDFNEDSRADLAVVNMLDNSVTVLYGEPGGGFGGRRDYAVGGMPRDIVAADFNGDGRLDLAVANFADNDVSILWGLPGGAFGSRQDYGVGAGPTGIVSGDFNGDDRRDLATANYYDNTVTVLYKHALGGYFTGRRDIAVGHRPSDLATEDFNGDGRLDLAVANFYDSDVSILWGLPGGAFGSRQDYSVGARPVAIVAGDFSGDARVDLATANYSANTVSVLYKLELGGYFGLRLDVEVGRNPMGLAAGHFNEDTGLDLAVTNYTDGDVSVLWGLAGGGAGGRQDYEVGAGPLGIATGDFNSDTVLDLAVANFADDDVSLLFGGPGGVTQHNDYPVGHAPREMVSADFNQDGRPDLAVVNTGDNDITVLLGQANGGLGDRRDYAVGATPRDIVAADFNGDGRLDLAVANFADNDVSILWGLSPGAFGSRQDYAVGAGPVAIVAGDFNSNGRLDLATANYSSNTVTVLYKKAVGGYFGDRQNIPVGRHPADLVAGDFNNDGRTDLAVANYSDSDVSVLWGLASGGVGSRQDYSLGAGPTAIVTGDFDRDGRLDLATANYLGNTASVLYKLAVGGYFGNRQDTAVGSRPVGLAPADLDRDNRLDLAVTNYVDHDVSVLYGQAGGALGDRADVATGRSPVGIVAADFNANEWLDLAVSSSLDDSVRLIYGEVGGTFPEVQDIGAETIRPTAPVADGLRNAATSAVAAHSTSPKIIEAADPAAAYAMMASRATGNASRATQIGRIGTIESSLRSSMGLDRNSTKGLSSANSAKTPDHIRNALLRIGSISSLRVPARSLLSTTIGSPSSRTPSNSF